MQFKYDCPYCLSASAGFDARFQWHHRNATSHTYILAVCGVCNHGIVVNAVSATGNTFPSVTNNFQFPSANLRILEVWPQTQNQIPEDLPQNVEKFFKQGIESEAGSRWDAAGAMFRKALDVATKILAPDLKNLNLFSRIERLVAEGKLTKDMGDWSHEIRIEGNDAVHDEEPETKTDVEALHKFTEALLTYAFTLPCLVAKNRSKREVNSENTE